MRTAPVVLIDRSSRNLRGIGSFFVLEPGFRRHRLRTGTLSGGSCRMYCARMRIWVAAVLFGLAFAASAGTTITPLQGQAALQARTDGPGNAQSASSAFAYAEPGISPDGREIAFSSGG